MKKLALFSVIAVQFIACGGEDDGADLTLVITPPVVVVSNEVPAPAATPAPAPTPDAPVQPTPVPPPVTCGNSRVNLETLPVPTTVLTNGYNVVIDRFTVNPLGTDLKVKTVRFRVEDSGQTGLVGDFRIRIVGAAEDIRAFATSRPVFAEQLYGAMEIFIDLVDPVEVMAGTTVAFEIRAMVANFQDGQMLASKVVDVGLDAAGGCWTHLMSNVSGNLLRR